VACVGERGNAFVAFTGKLEGKRLLERSRRRWVHTFDAKGIRLEGMNCVFLPWYMDK
jgi:hypothetical protein